MSEEHSLKKAPIVSIGMPVYNGGELLKLAIESLLKQEFTDFELIITDNASTDNTEETCQSYAKQDSRIKYIRRDKNYGASNNSILAYRQSVGKYYVFASHDDQWHPRFVSSCIKILDEKPNAVLAVPALQFLNPFNGTFCEQHYPPLHTEGLNTRSKVAAIFNETNIGFNIYGMFRKSALSKINIELDCYGADVVILMQMIFLGDVIFIPQKLFYYRLNNKSAQEQMDSIRKISNEKHLTKPYTSLTINLLRAIVNSDITEPLKRIILSDAIEIITLKNMKWRNVLLSENKTLVPYIDCNRNGFSSNAASNIISIFSSLLLPYCQHGKPFERIIDFSVVETFGTMPFEEQKPPVPGLFEFIETLTKQIEAKRPVEMLAYYDRYRKFMPDTESIVHIDAMINKFRK